MFFEFLDQKKQKNHCLLYVFRIIIIKNMQKTMVFALFRQRCEVWNGPTSLCLESMKSFVVLGIDEDKPSSSRGQECEVWKAPAPLRCV